MRLLHFRGEISTVFPQVILYSVEHLVLSEPHIVQVDSTL